MKNFMNAIQAKGAVIVMTGFLALPAIAHAQTKGTTRTSQSAPRSSSRPSTPAPQRLSESPSRSSSSNTHSTGSSSNSTSSAPTPSASPTRNSTPANNAPARSTYNSSTPTRTSSNSAASSPAVTSRPAQAPRPMETGRSDGSRVVTASHGRGFVERPVAARPGFVARTYVAGGRSYVRVYRSYSFRGVVYHRYVPAFYFHPGFYAWAYNPWATPVVFSWGFDVAPWYGYYGLYFTPAPVYATPSLWFTDFLIAENLKAAYEARQQAGDTAPAVDSQAAITPEIKELIAQQVRLELAAERKEADGETSTSADSTPVALNPSQRVFVVSMNLDAPAADGGTCALTPGDIIYRTASAGDVDGSVGVTILSSKAGDCEVNSNTTVELASLEEMLNDFRQQIGEGLSVLAKNRGKGGLPNGPAPNPRAVAEGQAEVDLNASSAVLGQQEAALKNR